MVCGEEEGEGTLRRACGGSSSSTHSSEEDEAVGDDGLAAPLLRSPTGREVRIDLPVDRPYEKYPPEVVKFIISFALLACAAFMDVVVLSVVHERVPPGPPLPDVFFDLTPYNERALEYAEYCMISNFVLMILLTIFHRHRFIILRRIGVIGSLLYALRAITMLVTQVPVADPNYYCSPKLGPGNLTFGHIITRALEVAVGMGLKIYGKHTLCGDYIYSGHTIVLVVSALFIGEYSPRRWRLLHVLTWLVAFAGMVLLVVSRGHYTIDIVISYFVCTIIFWAYHTMAAYPQLRVPTSNNHLSRMFWFPLFYYMERNVSKPIPRRFVSPLPWFRQALRRLKRNQQ